MDVQQLIDNLSQAIALGKLDPKAEVMISAPMECSLNPVDRNRKTTLTLPVLHVETGIFPADNKPWIMIRGTDAWGQNFGIRGTPHRMHDPWSEEETTPIYLLLEDVELDNTKG